MAKNKIKKMNEVKNSVIWHCVVCNKNMEHKEFLDHARTIHNVDTTKPASSQMIAHLDSTDWFSSTYKIITDNNVEFTKTVVCKRAVDDIMGHMDY